MKRAVYVRMKYSRTFSTTGRIVGCLAGERACWSPAQLCQGVVMHLSTAIRVAKHGSDTKDLCQIMKTKEHVLMTYDDILGDNFLMQHFFLNLTYTLIML